MRRGRVPVTAQPAPSHPHKPSPSPGRVTSGDPFAALDAKAASPGSPDELSSRFPSLDQFSLLHDQGAKFNFESPKSPPLQNQDLSQKVTQHLADEAFARPRAGSPELAEPPRPRTVTPAVAPASGQTTPSLRSPPPTVDVKKTASAPPKPSEMSRASAIIIQNPELQAISAQSTQRYVSTATGASPPLGLDKGRGSPIWRVPSDHHRSTSLPRQPENMPLRVRAEEPRAASPRIAASSLQPVPGPQASLSSRPSLEGGRPSAEYIAAAPSARSSQRERPASTHLESSLDFLRERQNAKTSPSPLPSPRLPDPSPPSGLVQEGETNIESNVDFLRSMEESNAKKDRSSWHIKKASVSSTSSGSKNIFAGKFGDAFKRFEQQPASRRTPSPQKELDRRELTPIAGSEATDGRSDDGRAHDVDDMSPERRREMERLQLEEEERRVEAAQAEYRQRKAAQGQSGKGPVPPPKPAGGSSRAISIQNRMQSLLDESQKGSVTRTAQGYGVYSDAAHASSRVEKQLPDIPRKPIATMPPPQSHDQEIVVNKLRHPSTEPLPSGRGAMGAKPPAPRKPVHLNNIPTGGSSAPQLLQSASSPSGRQVTELGLSNESVASMTSKEKDDYLSDFSKRFPSLSAIEMVETDIDVDSSSGSRR